MITLHNMEKTEIKSLYPGTLYQEWTEVTPFLACGLQGIEIRTTKINNDMDIIKSNRIKELIESIDKDSAELQSILNESKNKKFVVDLAIIPDYKIDDLTKDKWIKYFEENGIEFIDSSNQGELHFTGLVKEQSDKQ